MLCGACLFDAMGGRYCQFGALFCGSVLQTCWSVLRRVRNTVRLHVRKRARAARTLAVARTHVGQLYICHKILQFYFPRLEHGQPRNLILRIYCHSSQSYSQSSVRAQSELQSELSQSWGFRTRDRHSKEIHISFIIKAAWWLPPFSYLMVKAQL